MSGREVLYEECAESSNPKIQKAIYKVYSVMFWIVVAACVFLTVFTLLFFDLPTLILCLLTYGSAFLFYFLRSKIYYCIDIIFVSGSTRLIKVVNYKRRKKILIYDAKEVSTVGKVGSETFDKLYKTPNVKKIFAAPDRTAETLYYVFLEQSGVRYLVILQCKEDYLKNLVAFSGRGIIEKDYK